MYYLFFAKVHKNFEFYKDEFYKGTMRTAIQIILF